MIPWTQQAGSAVPRPRTGETPIRHVRVADSLWSQVAAIAKEQGRTMSAVVLDALKRYVAWWREQKNHDASHKTP